MIPVRRESEFLLETLASLTDQNVNIIVVVNEAEDSDDAVSEDNQKLLTRLDAWEDELWVVDRTDARPLKGGVGGARRLGFDLAMHRIGERSGCLIASLDADSPVDDGWGRALESAAEAGESIRTWFEHPLDNDFIASYELWHRYLAAGMRCASSPYAYDVLGCAFAVTPNDYAIARGMPRRTATEDFHFVNKVVKVRGPAPLEVRVDAVVRPSARASDRVPLGTGPAVSEIADGSERWSLVESPEAFADVAAVYEAVQEVWQRGWSALELSQTARLFFEEHGWHSELERVRQSSTKLEVFERALWTWFDAMRALRLFNHVATQLERVPLREAVEHILGIGGDSDVEVLSRVRRARRLDLEVGSSVP